MRWGERPALTPAQQYYFLQRNPICQGEGVLDVTGLTWDYMVRPSDLGREYHVRITFKRDGVPDAYIVSPDIEELAEGKDLPHVYYNPVRLCLYLPGSGEWKGSMRIDQTFVPWVVTWLFYFEEWLASGDWKGGGEHPSPEAQERYARRFRRAGMRPI